MFFRCLRIAYLLLIFSLTAGFAAGTEIPRHLIEQEIFNRLNSIRDEHRIHSLLRDRAADAAAVRHAEELARRRTLSHRGIDGTRVLERYRLAGGTGLSAGENLGAGDTLDSIVTAWMQSQAHRENILNEAWFRAGVGCSSVDGGRLVIVVVFSDSRWDSAGLAVETGRLKISGSFLYRPGYLPDGFLMRFDGRTIPPESASAGSDRIDMVFSLPLPESTPAGRPLAIHVGSVKSGTVELSDLLMVNIEALPGQEGKPSDMLSP
jgi:hypothetical protein